VAGNVSATSANFVVTIDTSAAAPVFTGITTDTGSPSTDRITTDQTLFLNGTSEANATGTVTRVGTGVVGSTTADGSGNWSFNYTGTTLAAGTHTFTATQADVAGNVSGVSANFVVTIDTTAPTVTVNQAAGQGDPVNSVPVHFTVTFSEVVSGFDTTDVTLGGTATGKSVSSVTDSGDHKIYNVADSATGGGTITATVAASRAVD